MLLKSQYALSKNDVPNIAPIIVLCQKDEKCFSDARINALKLGLGGLPAALASNLQKNCPPVRPQTSNYFNQVIRAMAFL